MPQGINGFRWFVVNGQRGHGWKKCPCGWRPDLGIHYAAPPHVEWWKEIRKKLGNQEAIDRYIWNRVSADWPPFLRKLRMPPELRR
jgi:hypothetical protein